MLSGLRTHLRTTISYWIRRDNPGTAALTDTDNVPATLEVFNWTCRSVNTWGDGAVEIVIGSFMTGSGLILGRKYLQPCQDPKRFLHPRYSTCRNHYRRRGGFSLQAFRQALRIRTDSDDPVLTEEGCKRHALHLGSVALYQCGADHASCTPAMQHAASVLVGPE